MIIKNFQDKKRYIVINFPDNGAKEVARQWELVVIPIGNLPLTDKVPNIPVESVKKRQTPSIDIQVNTVIRDPSR